MYISYIVFAKLYEEAESYQDIEMYISERGWQEWMDNYKVEEVVEILNAVYTISKLTYTEIRERTKLSRVDMSRYYKIPLRTLESWEYGQSEPDGYKKLFFMYIMFEAFVNKENMIGCKGED